MCAASCTTSARRAFLRVCSEKPGALTLAERRVMETHSEIGERILAKVEDYAEIARIVRHHHEQWDGQGYPDGLARRPDPVDLTNHRRTQRLQRASRLIAPSADGNAESGCATPDTARRGVAVRSDGRDRLRGDSRRRERGLPARSTRRFSSLAGRGCGPPPQRRTESRPTSVSESPFAYRVSVAPHARTP